MEEVGLVSSDTGQPGGKKTGQFMTHFVDPNGLFLKSFNKLSQAALEGLRLKYLPTLTLDMMMKPKGKGSTEGTDKGGEDDTGTKEPYNSKTKYSCPCGNNAWGKPRLKMNLPEASLGVSVVFT
jgi:hypothetical protein